MRYLTDEASASAELSRFDVRLSRQQAQWIESPADGVIMRRVAGQESRIFKAGEVLAVLVPDTMSRAVELWVSGNDMPLIQEGQTVRIQFEGWPALQFSGWPSVAVGTFGGVVSLVDPADDGHGKFRILISPDGKSPWPSVRYLRQGVRVMGWVLLNPVRLGFELWRQFNQFPPTLQSPSSFFDDPSSLESDALTEGKKKK